MIRLRLASAAALLLASVPLAAVGAATATPLAAPARASGPVVKAVQPSTGAADSSTRIKLTGKRLDGVRKVWFDGVRATGVRVVDKGTVRATAPPHSAGTVDVQVKAHGRRTTLARFTYVGHVPAPQLLDVAPGHGRGGDAVTITGSGFAAPLQVTFGGIPATVSSISPTRVVVTAPPHADGPADVQLTTPGGAAVSQPLAAFLYSVPSTERPDVTGLSPWTGVPGRTIQINGTNFGGLVRVTFDGTPAQVLAVSPTQLSVVVPQHDDTYVHVAVSTTAGEEDTWDPDAQFYYASWDDFGPPDVYGHTPLQGPTAGGQEIDISGNSLRGVTEVWFGAVKATSFYPITALELRAVSPPHTEGVVDLRLVNAFGSSQPSQGTKYYYDAPPPIQPVVQHLAPYVGPTAGGNTVTVTGTGFTGVTRVTFGGVPGRALTVLSDTELHVTAPPHTRALVDVVVLNPKRSSYAEWWTKYLYDDDAHTQLTPMPYGGTSAQLGDVACPAVDTCVAVGLGGSTSSTSSSSYAGVSEVWQGGAWHPSLMPTPADYAADLNPDVAAISCPGPTTCFAVGHHYSGTHRDSQPTIYRWDGATWTVQPTPLSGGATEGRLDHIDCVSAISCVAIGSYCTGPAPCGPLSAQLSGGVWTTRPVVPPAGALDVNVADLDCWSVSGCVAVGDLYNEDPYYDYTPAILRFDGTTWTVTRAVEPGDASPTTRRSSLSSVSCTAEGCRALGAYRTTALDRQVYLATVTTAGDTARHVPAPAGAADDMEPYDVDIACPTFNGCRAIAGYEFDHSGYGAEVVTVRSGTPTVEVVPRWPGAADYDYTAVHSLTCVSFDSCVAVGDDMYTQISDTLTTTFIPLPTGPFDPYGHHYYRGIALSSPTSAVAVGSGDVEDRFGRHTLGLVTTGIPLPSS